MEIIRKPQQPATEMISIRVTAGTKEASTREHENRPSGWAST